MAGLMERTPWWVPWLFAAAFLASSLWSNTLRTRSVEARTLLRDSQVEACERGNLVRRNINERGRILREFLVTAAEARQQTADTMVDDHAQRVINQRAADRWQMLAARVDDLPISDCENIIPQVASVRT